MNTIIFGNGNLGNAIAGALVARGDSPPLVLGRPMDRHRAAGLVGATLVYEASRADAVVPNISAALAAGCRRFVIATTGWEEAHEAVADALAAQGAAAVAAPNFSLGVVLYLRLVESAGALARRLAPATAFDPFILEWHRRGKLDRPSGTAREIARRLASPTGPGVDGSAPDVVVVRAGSSPGMHVVTFDAPGETIELRHTARDRSAFAAGAIAAADWLGSGSRDPGIHRFDDVIDALVEAGEKPEAVGAS
jgi:4-hydroxy-tetrahydrodipicolinate reductase